VPPAGNQAKTWEPTKTRWLVIQNKLTTGRTGERGTGSQLKREGNSPFLPKQEDRRMRCKIIKIGPADAFCRERDIKRLHNQKGVFKRSDTTPCKWLQGRFIFDDPKITSGGRLSFYQICIQPLEPWS